MGPHVGCRQGLTTNAADTWGLTPGVDLNAWGLTPGVDLGIGMG
jgi:hypothetical protein